MQFHFCMCVTIDATVTIHGFTLRAEKINKFFYVAIHCVIKRITVIVFISVVTLINALQKLKFIIDIVIKVVVKARTLIIKLTEL